jgi:apolipoprotein N-acyltransferase
VPRSIPKARESQPDLSAAFLSPSATAVLLAVASAVLSRATCPPFDLAPLALVAWAPLLVVFARSSMRQSFLLGWLQGALTNLLAFHWLALPLHSVAGLSWPASLGALVLLCAWQGLRVALLGASYGAVRRAGRFAPLVLAALLAFIEGVFPMVFAWGTYGFVHAAPIWAQTASIGGGALVTACLGGINQELATQVVRRGSLRRYWTAIVAMMALTAFGSWRIRRVDADLAGAPRSRALVVQGNLLPARLERRDPANVYRDASLAALRLSPDVDWVVWPETAIFYPTRADRLSSLFRDVLLRDRMHGPKGGRIDRPLVTGMVVDEGEERYNAVVAVDASGRVTGRYDKRALVPLGETRVADEQRPPFTSRSGGEPALLSVRSHAVATVVCFEALDSSLVRVAMAGGRAELLLNPTSDAWFAGSIGPRMHLAFAQIRAIENQRYLLRPTTTGKTALIDPAGRLVWSLPEGEATSGIAEVAWLESVTIFTRHGSPQALLGACALVISASLLRSWRRRAAV